MPSVAESQSVIVVVTPDVSARSGAAVAEGATAIAPLVALIAKSAAAPAGELAAMPYVTCPEMCHQGSTSLAFARPTVHPGGAASRSVTGESVVEGHAGGESARTSTVGTLRGISQHPMYDAEQPRSIIEPSDAKPLITMQAGDEPLKGAEGNQSDAPAPQI
jgi:hypothetical protein